jgi:hypothetical protein
VRSEKSYKKSPHIEAVRAASMLDREAEYACPNTIIRLRDED